LEGVDGGHLEVVLGKLVAYFFWIFSIETGADLLDHFSIQ
jgi:hypothetical protein